MITEISFIRLIKRPVFANLHGNMTDCATGGRADKWTNERTGGQTNPLIKMRGGIKRKENLHLHNARSWMECKKGGTEHSLSLISDQRQRLGINEMMEAMFDRIRFQGPLSYTDL